LNRDRPATLYPSLPLGWDIVASAQMAHPKIYGPREGKKADDDQDRAQAGAQQDKYDPANDCPRIHDDLLMLLFMFSPMLSIW
jgi:hypothetical protein